MKYLKLFEYYTNPYNPNEIWEDGVQLSKLEGDQKKEFLDSLVGKTIEFLSSIPSKKVGPVKLIEYELDSEDSFMDVYFETDDGDYKVNDYGNIKIIE